MRYRRPRFSPPRRKNKAPERDKPPLPIRGDAPLSTATHAGAHYGGAAADHFVK
jgi:hypothetical protein